MCTLFLTLDSDLTLLLHKTQTKDENLLAHTVNAYLHLESENDVVK